MFKLINFLEMPAFNLLRSKMRAPLANDYKTDLNLNLLDKNTLISLGGEGIEIESFADIATQEDNTLGYKNQRVLVYIRDVNHYQSDSKPKLPKYHVSFCKMLQEMKAAGRWKRYVVANRDDGLFCVKINNEPAKWIKLDVCQFCLATLKWAGFCNTMQHNQRYAVVSAFTIKEFFKKFPKSLFTIVPDHTSDVAPINDYTKNWANVSASIKKDGDYQCETPSCKIRLYGENAKYLHVHHINGQKNDNTKGNLKVLCIRCHANEPHHGHMKGTLEYGVFVGRFGG